MSYESAMVAAGATIHRFTMYGSYQGDWIAEVSYNGQRGFVRGSYGSCSGCDHYEAEFSGSGHECPDGEYRSIGWSDPYPNCEQCVANAKKLAEFGRDYLNSIASAEAMIKELEEGLEWSYDREELYEKLHFVDPDWKMPKTHDDEQADEGDITGISEAQTNALNKMKKDYPAMTSGDLQSAGLGMQYLLKELDK